MSSDKRKTQAREYGRLAYQNDPEKFRKRKLEASIKNPVKTNLAQLKQRARIKSLEFNITEDDVVIPELCPVLGIPLVFNKGARVPQRNSVSFDRKDSGLGYVKGNITVMSYAANRMKNDASPEELRAFAKWVLRTFPEEVDA